MEVSSYIKVCSLNEALHSGEIRRDILSETEGGAFIIYMKKGFPSHEDLFLLKSPFPKANMARGSPGRECCFLSSLSGSTGDWETAMVRPHPPNDLIVYIISVGCGLATEGPEGKMQVNRQWRPRVLALVTATGSSPARSGVLT